LGYGAAGGGACPVDNLLRAGDRRGEIRAWEQHGVGDLVGGDVAADRDRRLVAPADTRGVGETALNYLDALPRILSWNNMHPVME
jgi:hypothetical protein